MIKGCPVSESQDAGAINTFCDRCQYVPNMVIEDLLEQTAGQAARCTAAGSAHMRGAY